MSFIGHIQTNLIMLCFVNLNYGIEAGSSSCLFLFDEEELSKTRQELTLRGANLQIPNMRVQNFVKLKISKASGLRSQVFGNSNKLLLRSRGYLSIVEFNRQSKAIVQELSALNGLEDTISSVAEFNYKIWISKRSVFAE